MASSLPCNFEHNILPRPLCQSTCLSFVDSVEAIIRARPSICANADFTSHLRSQCNIEALSGTSDAQCIIGSENESELCGAIVGAAILGILIFLLYRCWLRRSIKGGAYEAAQLNEPETTMQNEKKWMDHIPEDAGVIPGLMLDGHIGGMSRVQTSLEGFCRVIYAKEPDHDDEISLSEDDIIRMYYYFDDGWALGDNYMTGERGMFPLLCVVKMSPSEIYDIFTTAELQVPEDTVPYQENSTTDQDNSSYQLTTAGMQKLRRSVSSHTTHEHPTEALVSQKKLPQRSVSMHSPFARWSKNHRRAKLGRAKLGSESSLSVRDSGRSTADTTTNSRTHLNDFT
ncbi:hypothetical protein EC973_003577 [Apophysomyces ossiformis]|uniref:SH3 domain-containing protein n=1 Tax=Apophysomyces ossiformis TaxID=679940 RepID=A0A8H7ERM5_9FUNG|nr:hypothetical protein EC973_003577 [Apophysomyces ossiformis]